MQPPPNPTAPTRKNLHHKPQPRCDDLATDPENDDYDISNVALRTPLALESVLRAEEISAVPRFKRLVERCLVVEADRRADCEELLEILDPENKYML